MPKRARSLRFPDVALEKGSSQPLCMQLYAALRSEIVNGRLSAGQQLPSSRILAKYLSVSRNTVLEAFERLVAAGYLLGKVGSGTRVARPQPHTYLSELPRLMPIRIKSFRQTVRESFYPAHTACLQDSEGNGIYLFTLSDGEARGQGQ
jgi:GntR family transcriptional regulator/MocR family aminotransferase